MWLEVVGSLLVSRESLAGHLTSESQFSHLHNGMNNSHPAKGLDRYIKQNMLKWPHKNMKRCST